MGLLTNGSNLFSCRPTYLPLLLCVLLSLASSVHAVGPDWFSYQIPFPPSPTDALGARMTILSRAEPLLAALACGSEIDYALDQETSGEDTTALLVAKMEWASGHPDARGVPQTTKVCTFTRYFRPSDLCAFFLNKTACEPEAARLNFGNELAKDWKNAPGRTVWKQKINDALAGYFPHCASTAQPTFSLPASSPPHVDLTDVTVPAPPPGASDPASVRLDFTVDHQCLLAQINHSLLHMAPTGEMGSSKLPCHLVNGETGGEWDFSVRNLTRLAYQDRRHDLTHGQHLLGPAALTHLHDRLLTADGGPADTSYPITGCGNREESTGSSQDRVDERDWTDEPFWQTIGDIFSFLWKLLVVIAIVYLIVSLLVAAGAGILGALAATATAVGLAVVIALQPVFPETENHLLMINSSKFLKNQLIISEVPDSEGTNRYRKDQAQVKEWLLAKMQSLVSGDFIEYNSRPYGRLSMFALYNLADFSEDADVRDGARLVLDYMSAKFAVGAHQGRRFVPFRRKREDFRKFIDVTAPNENHTGLFDLLTAGDVQIGLGLLYSGQTQQMRNDYVSFGAAVQALYALTSSYSPEDLVMDLAIQKKTPVFQRIRHFTMEAYSSGEGYLISAGGTQTGPAYTGTGIPAFDLAIRPELKDDYGVALPTTLFLSKSPLDDTSGPPARFVSRTTLAELIRIDGMRLDRNSAYPTYDNNLCVWDGFACGLNLVVPAWDGSSPDAGFSQSVLLGAAGPCVSKGPAGSAPEWDFIDTRRCGAYVHAPRVFVVIYRQACPAFSAFCEDNFGFLEAVPADTTENFDAFKAKITAANPPGFMQVVAGTLPVITGTYRSARNQTIKFSASDSAILSVDGKLQTPPGSWEHAQGSPDLPLATRTPITSKGDGLVRIWNPTAGKTMELDFRDRNHPKPRRVY